MEGIKTRQVIGFRYNSTGIVMIEKTKPEWLAGLVTGIGGKVELGETDSEAMAREFVEETGIPTSSAEWKRVGSFSGSGWDVAVLVSHGHFAGIGTGESDEGAVSVYTRIPSNIERTCEWLVMMLFDVSLLPSTSVVMDISVNKETAPIWDFFESNHQRRKKIEACEGKDAD